MNDQVKNLINKIKYPLLLICFLAVVTVIAVNAINSVHPIIGKWHDAETGVVAEFFSSDQLIWIDPRLETSMYGVHGTYTINDETTLTTEWERNTTMFSDMIGTNAWTFTIDDDSMTMKNNRHTYHFTRID